VILVGLFTNLLFLAGSLGFLSTQGNVLLHVLGILLAILYSFLFLVGGAGISWLLAQRLVGSDPPPLVSFGTSFSLMGSLMIPVIGWFLVTPLYVFASCGSSVISLFQALKRGRAKPPDRNVARAWLGMTAPAWLLFFLSPVVGELLSGSAPPTEFFQPFSLLILAALYGSGALLVREFTFRWGKGWLAILLLGAAYGIVEEGLMVKSFFDPNWMDLGLLGTYGRWLGVNWIWSLELTVYHSVFSIAIPILLAELLFPKTRSTAWVSSGALRGLSILLTLDVLLGFSLLTTYRPPILPYLASIGSVFLLYVIAKVLPSELRAKASTQPKNPGWVGLLAFVGTAGLFVISWVLPTSNLPAVLTFVILACWVILVLVLIGWLLGWGDGSWRHRFALVTGGLSFFILLTPLQELDTSRMDNPSGMVLVGLVFTIFLIYVWLFARKVEESMVIP
jgi:hypothetical protein